MNNLDFQKNYQDEIDEYHRTRTDWIHSLMESQRNECLNQISEVKISPNFYSALGKILASAYYERCEDAEILFRKYNFCQGDLFALDDDLENFEKFYTDL